MDSANDYTALRFTTQASTGKTLDKVRVYVNNVTTGTGTGVSWTLELRSDDGTANHYPSATVLTSGTLTVTGTGWQIFDITNYGMGNTGTIYHVVIYSASASATEYIGIRRSFPHHKKYPPTNVTDDYTTCHWSTDAGSIWTDKVKQPIYVLEYADASYEGNAFRSESALDIYGTTGVNSARGEKFIPSGNKTICELAFYVNQTTTNPAGNLLYRVEKAADSSLVVEGTLATPGELTEWTWKTATFNNVTLENGVTYWVYLKSPDSTSSTACYRLCAPRTLDGAPYNTLTYDGTNSVYIDTIDTWTEDSARDAAFRFTESSIVKIIIQKWRELYH